jgi:hypothetical protein
MPNGSHSSEGMDWYSHHELEKRVKRLERIVRKQLRLMKTAEGEDIYVFTCISAPDEDIEDIIDGV